MRSIRKQFTSQVQAESRFLPALETRFFAFLPLDKAVRCPLFYILLTGTVYPKSTINAVIFASLWFNYPIIEQLFINN